MALDVGFHAHILYRMIWVDAVVAHINSFFFRDLLLTSCGLQPN